MKNTELKKRKPFDNEERTRYYGIRVGDKVSRGRYKNDENAELGDVIEYGILDNNCVFVKWSSAKKPSKEVAEWLKVVEKVEDRAV